MLHSHLCAGIPSCLFLSRFLTKILHTFFGSLHEFWDTQRRSNSRYWATSRKVAGSISDGVTDIILPAALWPLGRLNLQQNWVPGIFPGEGGGDEVKADGDYSWKPYHLHVVLIVLKPHSWKFQVLWKPVQRLFYITVHSTYTTNQPEFILSCLRCLAISIFYDAVSVTVI